MSNGHFGEGGLTRVLPALSILMWDKEKASRLGATIRAFRTDAGMSQETFAYRAGLTKNQIQLIESGRGAKKGEAEGGPSNPGIATLDGVASALSISVAELLTAAHI